MSLIFITFFIYLITLFGFLIRFYVLYKRASKTTYKPDLVPYIKDIDYELSTVLHYDAAGNKID